MLFSKYTCFEKLKPYLGGLAIFHTSSVCEGVRKVAKPHKFGFSFPKQGSAEIFKMHLFNTGPVVHLRVVQLNRNFGSKPKIGIYGHLIFYLLSFWPTVTALATPLTPRQQYTVSEYSIFLPIHVANMNVNAIWAREGPLNAWKVIPTHCQGAQGHFGSDLTHLKWPIVV